MAPKGRPATKRGRGASPEKIAASPAKKGRGRSPSKKVDPTVQTIVDAVSLADIPEDCRNMMVAALPYCLGVTAEERLPCQAAMVKCFGDMMEAVKAQLKVTVDSAAVAFAEVQGSKGDLEKKVADAALHRSEAEATVSAKTVALSEKTSALGAAKAALSERQKEQKEGDAEAVKAGKDKDIYDAAVAKELVMLRDGTWEKKADATVASKVIMKLATALKLDESLMGSAPSVLVKKPDERGAFENIVMTTLVDSLTKHPGALQKILDEAAPASAARAAAAEEAQKVADAAAQAKETGATELKSAKAALKDASAAVTAANSALEDFVPSTKRAADAKDESDAALSNFSGHSMECFAALRDKVAEAVPEPAEEEPVAEETPAAAAAEEPVAE